MISCTSTCRRPGFVLQFMLCGSAVLAVGCTGTKSRVLPAVTMTAAGDAYHLDNSAARGARTLKATLVAEWPSGCACNDRAADEFLLTVTSDSGGKLFESLFCSSYGDFQIDLVDLTGDGHEEYVFLVGEGRGTSARREWLIVRRERDGHLVDVLREVRSDYFGSGVNWWYDYAYVDLNGDGITDLQLTLDHSPTDMAVLQNPEDIPTDKVKDYCWDPHSGCMKQINAATRPRTAK